MQVISPFLSTYLFALWLKLESDQELWYCKSMLLKRSHGIAYFCIPKLKIMLHSSTTSFVYFWFDLIHANVKLGCHLYSRIYKRTIHISFLIFFFVRKQSTGEDQWGDEEASWAWKPMWSIVDVAGPVGALEYLLLCFWNQTAKCIKCLDFWCCRSSWCVF